MVQSETAPVQICALLRAAVLCLFFLRALIACFLWVCRALLCQGAL